MTRKKMKTKTKIYTLITMLLMARLAESRKPDTKSNRKKKMRMMTILKE